LPLSLYDASVPLYLRMLRNLEGILGKAKAHAAEKGVDLSVLTEARLAPDMFPLTRQIQSASDAAKSGAARLAGVTAPSFEDTETTFPELEARIAKTISFLETIKPEQMAGAETRIIELPLPNRTLSFTGTDFLFQFSLPNFMFHVVTAYDVLRAQGVGIGKMDFLAGAHPIG
jgi:uncharacterized protein